MVEPAQLSPREVLDKIRNSDLPEDRKRAAMQRAAELGLVPSFKPSRETPAGPPNQDVILAQPEPSMLSKLFPAAGIREVLGSQTGAVGSIAAQLLASRLPGAALLRPLLGAAGAVVGQQARQLFGLPAPTTQEMAVEGGSSLALGAGEEALRGGVRNFTRQLPGGVALRKERAQELITGIGQRAFNAPAKAEVDQAFEAVRNIGVTADLTPLQQSLSTIRGGNMAGLIREVSALDADLGRALRHIAAGRNPANISGAFTDVGELQRIRSLLHQQANNLEFSNRAGGPTLARNLRITADGVDDAIDAALATAPGGVTPQGQTIVQAAREANTRYRAAAELENLAFESGRYKDQILQLDLDAALNKLRQLQRPEAEAVPRRQRGLRRAFDQFPEAAEAAERELADLARSYKVIQFSQNGREPFALRFPIARSALSRVSQVLTTPTGRRLFSRAVIEGRGTFSLNYLPLIEQAISAETARQAAVAPEGVGPEAALQPPAPQ